MRWLRQFPQLRQSAGSPSGTRGSAPANGVVFHFLGPRTLQPGGQLFVPESPLPADFDRRNLFALRPQADCPGGDPQPFCNCCGGQEGFTVRCQFLHRLGPVIWKNVSSIGGGEPDSGLAVLLARNDSWLADLVILRLVSEISGHGVKVRHEGPDPWSSGPALVVCKFTSGPCRAPNPARKGGARDLVAAAAATSGTVSSRRGT